MRELDINLRRVNESNVQLGISSADIRNEISELLVTSRDLNRVILNTLKSNFFLIKRNKIKPEQNNRKLMPIAFVWSNWP